MIIDKPINLLDEADLLELKGRSESLQLEVKEYHYQVTGEIADQSERNKALLACKIELCEDVSAFANSRGGLIVLGAKEKEGEIKEISGLEQGLDADKEIRRLGNIIDDGIEPKIIGLEFGSVRLSTGRHVLLLSVPQSLNAPHRVKRTGRFHVRRSMRKDEMDILELRQKFVNARILEEQVLSFIEARLHAILNNDRTKISLYLNSGPKLILHFVPLNFAENAVAVDLQQVRRETFGSKIGKRPDPAAKNINNSAYNFHGILVADSGYPVLQHDTTFQGYTQYFRNGAIERAKVLSIARENSQKLLQISEFESQLLIHLPRLLWAMEELSIAPPLVMALSLLDGDGITLKAGQSNGWYDTETVHVLQTPSMRFPLTLLQTYPKDENELMIELRDLLNVLANVFGMERYPYFGEQGQIIRIPDELQNLWRKSAANT